MERFNLRKLNVVQGKEKCRVEVSNRFGALEDLDTEVEINTVWETITENIKISAKESLGYYVLKPWFDKGCSKLLDQSKQAKLQWLQDPNEILTSLPKKKLHSSVGWKIYMFITRSFYETSYIDNAI
jgi:hypothetical protein